MSVSAQITQSCTITEILEGNVASSSPSNRTVTHSLFNVAKTLNATSTPAATKTANFVQTGAGNIDLTALLGANNVVVSGSGLQVVYVRITNLGTQAIAIAAGETNGHSLWGTGLTIGPGETISRLLTTSQVIDSTHKVWTVTDPEEEAANYQFTILLGTPPA